MKYYYLLFLLCLCGLWSLNAQVLKKETLSSQRSSHFVYAPGKSYFIQDCIGQGSVIHTFEANNHSLRQGFLQPISPSVIAGNNDDTLNAIVYPNPFITSVTIKFQEPIYDNLHVLLFDVAGRVLVDDLYDPNAIVVLQFPNVANGSYYLMVEMQGQRLQTKLIKK